MVTTANYLPLYAMTGLGIISMIFYWMVSTGKRLPGSSVRTSGSVDHFDFPENIPGLLRYRGLLYPIEQGIDRTKYDEQSGDYEATIYYDTDHGTQTLTTKRDRLVVSNALEDLTSGQIVVEYRGDEERSAQEVEAEQKDKTIDDLKTLQSKLDEDMEIKQMSEGAQKIKEGESRGARASSRTFGGHGARYDDEEKVRPYEGGDEGEGEES